MSENEIFSDVAMEKKRERGLNWVNFKSLTLLYPFLRKR